VRRQKWISKVDVRHVQSYLSIRRKTSSRLTSRWRRRNPESKGQRQIWELNYLSCRSWWCKEESWLVEHCINECLTCIFGLSLSMFVDLSRQCHSNQNSYKGQDLKKSETFVQYLSPNSLFEPHSKSIWSCFYQDISSIELPYTSNTKSINFTAIFIGSLFLVSVHL